MNEVNKGRSESPEAHPVERVVGADSREREASDRPRETGERAVSSPSLGRVPCLYCTRDRLYITYGLLSAIVTWKNKGSERPCEGTEDGLLDGEDEEDTVD